MPVNSWFMPKEARQVVMQAFRVYEVPFARVQPLPAAPLVVEFDLVRAVFGRPQELLYPDPEPIQLFPNPDGATYEWRPNQVLWTGPSPEDFRYLTDEETWRSTGDGIVLFLMTPFLPTVAIDEPVATRTSTPTEPGVDNAARERLIVARGAIVAVLGRNAAFEELFEVQLQFDDRGNSRLDRLTSGRLSPRSFDSPKLDGNSAKSARQVVDQIQSLDVDTKNRLALALRWYLLAQRHPLSKNETNVDVFISYWIALESLAGPTEAVPALRKALTEIHSLHSMSNQQLEDSLFPVGRIFRLRGRIVHHGEVPEIGYELLNLMDNLFVDVLLHTLGLPSASKTAAYLDGSAVNLLP